MQTHGDRPHPVTTLRCRKGKNKFPVCILLYMWVLKRSLRRRITVSTALAIHRADNLDGLTVRRPPEVWLARVQAQAKATPAAETGIEMAFLRPSCQTPGVKGSISARAGWAGDIILYYDRWHSELDQLLLPWQQLTSTQICPWETLCLLLGRKAIKKRYQASVSYSLLWPTHYQSDLHWRLENHPQRPVSRMLDPGTALWPWDKRAWFSTPKPNKLHLKNSPFFQATEVKLC